MGPTSSLHDSKLYMTRHLLHYSVDGYPLQIYATRISLIEGVDTGHSPNTLTLVIAHGVSMNAETYYPMVERLYELQGGSGSAAHIGTVWFVEAPNHGDSAILNKDVLRNHFSTNFPLKHYGEGIVVFMTSGLVDLHNPNLVTIGHCGGCVSLTFALDALVRDYGMASPHAILIEPALFDRRVESSCYRYVERIRRSNSKRKGWAWRNLDEAMAQTSKKSPWKTWHPDVMEWVRRTSFQIVPNPDASEGGFRVVTKTLAEQETAIFDADGGMDATPVLIKLLPQSSVHIILGETPDTWTKDMYENLASNIDENIMNLASSQVLKGAGHCVPQDNPFGLATILLDILVRGRTLRRDTHTPAHSISARL